MSAIPLLVSVIIPTYKRSELLSRAIDSVLNQNYLNVEIIVVDDNPSSSDYRNQTETIMQNYIFLTNVKYYKNISNVGGSSTRNNGILFSSGDYITFLDDDDIYMKGKIERQLDFMLKNNLEMSFTDLRIHDTNDNLLDYREYGFIKKFDKESLLKYHLLRQLTGTPTFMYKREALLRIGGFPQIKMGQEFLLMLNTIEAGVAIGYLPASDVIAYLHNDERVSGGHNKILGQLEMFEFKKKYFPKLTPKEIRFIKFRHNAVMAVAHKRNGNLMEFAIYAFRTFVTSPIDVCVEGFRYLMRLLKHTHCDNNQS